RACRSRVQEDVRSAELRSALEGRAERTGRTHRPARRPVLRDRGAHPARHRRQPVRDSRQPGARRARTVQDPSPGARPHGAWPFHGLRPARAARRARYGADGHQPRAHGRALQRADGADDGRGRNHPADDWVLLDPPSDQDRGVAVSLFLAPLGFVFISLLIPAAAMALSPSGAGVIERRLGEVSGTPAAAVEETVSYDAVVDGLKKLGRVIPRSPSEMGKLQQRLVTAGYRNNEAVAIFFGIRIGVSLLFFFLFATPILFPPNLFLAMSPSPIA